MLQGQPPESTDLPLPKSVFRALLARIAALCNERVPNSVSPYGGEGEIVLDTVASAVFRVEFTNTPAVQRLEIKSVVSDKDRIQPFAMPEQHNDSKSPGQLKDRA